MSGFKAFFCSYLLFVLCSSAIHASGAPLLRKSYADYPDGLGEVLRTEPNARRVSNAICDQEGDMPNRRGMSAAVWAWGQFLDHDIDLTDASAMNGTADIEVLDSDDPIGPDAIPFSRSNYVRDSAGVRQQINQITPLIDASNVYGSELSRTNALREFVGGRLKLQANGLLPYNVDGLENAGGQNPTLFVAGDVRANENVLLTSMHTLFVREHNRLAARIERLRPNWDDERIFQFARGLVVAQMQLITYREFLPALMGRKAPSIWPRRPADRVDPQIANEFSTVLFRFGHTMLTPKIYTDTGEILPLFSLFFNPSMLTNSPDYVDRLLGGLHSYPAQEIDNKIIDDVRNMLFLPPRPNFDLASLNIQRGRDHGIPPYNDLREAYGLDRINSIDDITSDGDLQQALLDVYDNIDSIDPWIGALAEDHVRGTSMGPLLLRGLKDQFKRLRDGDPNFLFRNPQLRTRLAWRVLPLHRVSLGWIIRKNTDARPPRALLLPKPNWP